MYARRKCAAIGQATRQHKIVHALATFIHKTYRSRELTDIPSSHVLAESYNEVVKLVNAQMNELFSRRTLWMAYNVSSTMLTSTLPLQLDMELSMQWVGGIAVTTPHFQAGSVPLQHLAKVEAASVIGSYNKIPLKYYNK